MASLARLQARALRLTILAMGPIVGTGIIAAGPLLDIWLGHEFAARSTTVTLGDTSRNLRQLAGMGAVLTAAGTRQTGGRREVLSCRDSCARGVDVPGRGAVGHKRRGVHVAPARLSGGRVLHSGGRCS